MSPGTILILYWGKSLTKVYEEKQNQLDTEEAE